ncbi:alcohol dehydrogenase catalytic domain-containing protein [Amycolatopsis oliviviridis]|uniref:IMP dehydrogenase n=1 Tax=Amycolatopsis oliviviridis TaxID=1471590 RepID=A0ABQ3LXE8_9PSEU|nr:alcohol dehydrogenase catalytic domain-containing protein [Amycolatopsis oliviviridis]GHH28305.1 IMP dehydrogenase [Amycolatopsis oliviviridis]
MKAAILRSPGSLAVTEVPDPGIEHPSDAVVRVVAAGICGTDLRGYQGRPGPVEGPRCGHEFVGVVTETGAEVRTVRPGQLVVAPFMFSDGDCVRCVRGNQPSCARGGMWGIDAGGGQAEAVRVPFADGTLIRVPMDERDERIPAVLALADVMATGHHALHASGRAAPATVAVVGDGAVGLCAVLAARRAGAERIFLFGHHEPRLAVGRGFGATDIVSAPATAGHAEVLEATGGAGVDLVVEAVGAQSAMDTAVAVCADGGAISLVGGPYSTVDALACHLRNVSFTGGVAPARSYLPELLDDVVAGRLDPSPVFDLGVRLDGIGDGYRAMADRQAIKVLVTV